MTASQSAGRPRDEIASRALKDAALELVRAEGYKAVSIRAIVEAARVSRQTLYNRWQGKAELVLDAMFEEAAQSTPFPGSDPEIPMRDQLERFLGAVFEHMARDGDIIRSLIAAAQEDVGFREAFHTRFVRSRERIVTELLEVAQSRDELAAHRDVAMLSTFVHGAFWYRLLTGQPLDETFAREIADSVFAV